MSENNSVTHYKPQPSQALSVFASEENFTLAQRIGKALTTSDLVPNSYQNNLPNTLVAMNIANRTGADVLMVMQNLNVIHGRPSWGSSFIIASLNSCGRFEPIRYRVEDRGEKTVEYTWNEWKGREKVVKTGKIKIQDKGCVAWTEDKRGNLLESPEVSIEMAVKEGWYTKDGSKWKTMPELMLRYRAAAFFGRLYAPEILMGMKATDEIEDIGYEVIDEPERSPAVNHAEPIINKLNEEIENAAQEKAGQPAPETASEPQEKEGTTPDTDATHADNGDDEEELL